MGFFEQQVWDARMYLGGWVPLEATAAVTSPWTGERLAAYAVATSTDVAAAVDLASSAQREWADVG